MPAYYDKITKEFSNLDFGNAYDKHDREKSDESSFITKIKKNFLNTDFEKRMDLINSFRYVFDDEIGDLNKMQILNFLDIYKTFGQNFAEDQIKPVFRNIKRSFLNDEEFVNLLLNHFHNSKMILLYSFVNDSELYNDVYLMHTPIKRYIDGIIISNIHHFYTHDSIKYCEESKLWNDYYQNIFDNIYFNNDVFNSILIYYSQSKEGYKWFEKFLDVFHNRYEFTNFNFDEDTMNTYIDLSIEFILSNFNSRTIKTTTYCSCINIMARLMCLSKATLKRYYNTRLKYIIKLLSSVNEQFFDAINETNDLDNVYLEHVNTTTSKSQIDGQGFQNMNTNLYGDMAKDINSLANNIIKTSQTNTITVLKPNPLATSQLYESIISDIDNTIECINNNEHRNNSTIELLLQNKNKLKNIINYSKLAT